MADFSNIPTGLKITSQIPLNTKEWCKNEATLAYLGIDDNLAFTYHDQIEIFCLEEKTLYIWREVQTGEENTGLIPLDFTYPLDLPETYNINYSGKTYNFFLKEYVTNENIDTYLENLVTLNNVGDGVQIYKETTRFDLRTLKSDTLNITISEDENSIEINYPNTSTIPSLYVNNLYIPTYEEFLNGNTKGEGTFAKPFTDTITYTDANTYIITSNTAIQNALDVYVGSGTRLNPELSGQTIIVQPNNTGYTFDRDFNYSNLKIKFEEDVICTTTGYLIDMDNSSNFDSENARVTIEILENKVLSVSDTLGFKNSGNTSTTPPSYSSGRLIVFLGNGEIYSNYNGVDVLTRYIFNGEGNNNDDGLHFQVECEVRSIYSGIYYCKNKQRIDFYNKLTSGVLNGSVNVSLQAFKMTGGQVRFFDKGSINITSETSGRNYGITFEPIGDGVGYCIFQLNSAKVTGSANYMFVKLNNEDVSFLAFNSPSGDGFATVLPGTGTIVDGLFENLGVDKWEVSFKNNVFSFTGIDFDKVDLTQGNNVSTVNFIGNNIIESLVVYSSKQAAQNAGITKGSRFLKRTLINATSIITGLEYKIASVGTTDFTLIGADSNTVDEWFVATGVGSGTGTVYLESIEII